MGFGASAAQILGIQAGVRPTWAKLVRTPQILGEIVPKRISVDGPSSPKFATISKKLSPSTMTFDHDHPNRPNSAEFGQFVAEPTKLFGSESARFGPATATCGPELSQIGPSSVKIRPNRPTWPGTSQNWPGIGQICTATGQCWTEISQFRQKLSRTPPNLARNRPKLSRFRPKPNSTKSRNWGRSWVRSGISDIPRQLMSSIAGLTAKAGNRSDHGSTGSCPAG